MTVSKKRKPCSWTKGFIKGQESSGKDTWPFKFDFNKLHAFLWYVMKFSNLWIYPTFSNSVKKKTKKLTITHNSKFPFLLKNENQYVQSVSTYGQYLLNRAFAKVCAVLTSLKSHICITKHFTLPIVLFFISNTFFKIVISNAMPRCSYLSS